MIQQMNIHVVCAWINPALDVHVLMQLILEDLFIYFEDIIDSIDAYINKTNDIVTYLKTSSLIYQVYYQNRNFHCTILNFLYLMNNIY